MQQRESSVPWVALTSLAIVLAGIVGVIAGLLLGPTVGDDFLGEWFLVALGIVAVAGAVQLRLFVLPTMLTADAALSRRAAPMTAPLSQRIQAATIVACAFALADAIYGIVAAVMLGEWIWPPLFGAFALGSLAITTSYVNAKADELARAEAIRA